MNESFLRVEPFVDAELAAPAVVAARCRAANVFATAFCVDRSVTWKRRRGEESRDSRWKRTGSFWSGRHIQIPKLPIQGFPTGPCFTPSLRLFGPWTVRSLWSATSAVEHHRASARRGRLKVSAERSATRPKLGEIS